jgi:OmpA-OmpF porin, OOP family
VFIVSKSLTVALTCIFLAAGFISTGQTRNYTKTPAMGLHLAYFDFMGADDLSSFGSQMKPGIAIHFQNNLSKRFGYNVSLAGSFLEFPDRKGASLSNGKKQLLLENDFSIWMRLLKSPAVVNPFILAGAGWSQYNNHYALYAPMGAGVQVNITPDIFLLLNTQYRMRLTSLQHQHFYHSIGIAGAISRKKIAREQPQPAPLPVVTNIPRDTDGDGIIDSLDACPQVAGVVRYKGCPLPDRDGDGIIDEEDNCPTVKGVTEYKGCPMPDKDKDGIADDKDKCPDMAGSAVNGGCPEIATLKIFLNYVAQNILFETASANLLPRSFSALDSLTNLLKNYSILQLTIEGHTDNVSSVTYNQKLSEKRAAAVMTYLTNAGITASRLRAAGYGQQKPTADNTTTEGRAKNRRVELKLSY